MVVMIVFQNFRRQVDWSAHSLTVLCVAKLQELRDTHIAEFYLVVGRHKNVKTLDITMQDVVAVHVCNTRQDLKGKGPQVRLTNVLLLILLSLHVLGHVAFFGVLHEYIHITLLHKASMKLDDIMMSEHAHDLGFTNCGQLLLLLLTPDRYLLQNELLFRHARWHNGQWHVGENGVVREKVKSAHLGGLLDVAVIGSFD